MCDSPFPIRPYSHLFAVLRVSSDRLVYGKGVFRDVVIQNGIITPDDGVFLQLCGYADVRGIIFTDYDEKREGETAYGQRNLRIKRIMEAPLRLRTVQRSIFARRLILAFGDPICCPAVTINKMLVPAELFSSQYKSCVDWDAWERLARLNGDFVYCPKRLMAHRIWPGSTTSACIDEHSRTKEELEILERFWPPFAATIISKLDSTAQQSNTVKQK